MATFALPRKRFGGEPKNQLPFTQPIIPGTTRAASTGRVGNPGYTPDFQQLITGDPLYQQQLANTSAAGVASAAQRKASTGQLLAQFGEVPDFAGMGLSPDSPLYKSLLGDVTPDVQRAAGDLTSAGLSTTAGLQRGHEQAVGDLLYRLAARGAVQSGATGFGLQQEDQNYAGQQFKARNDLLGYLTGVQQAFAQSEAGRQNQLTQSAQDATQRQIQLNPAVPATPGTGLFAPGYKPPPVHSIVPSLNLPAYRGPH